MQDFHFVIEAREMVAAAGSLDQVSTFVARLGWRRLLLCTSPSLERQGHVRRLRAVLGNKLVATYARVQAHVQDYQLAEVSAIADEYLVDAVIGMGGGSPIGMAKAISLALAEERPDRTKPAASPSEQSLIPVIAIPTTYAGSEMTAIFGVTHAGEGISRKVTVRDPRVMPRLVIYDPDLTITLPPELTASSGINSLAHCIEALYSTSRNPIATAAAQAGIQHIIWALPRCVADGYDREARTEMFTGSHLAAFALSLTKMGLHHGLCHVLGGSANVPHGIANGVILPHALRFNLDATAAQLALAGRSMGINEASDETTAEMAIDRVHRFIGDLGLPQHLQELGIDEQDLPKLGELALHSSAVQANPKPVTDAAQAEAVFRAAW